MIKKIINICLYSVLAIPLLVWGIFLFPYISPKTFLFRIIIEIALFLYILLIIAKPQYRPRFSKLTWIILIYILIMTFASIFGIDLYRSFWGNIERGEGLLTIYHLFVFFILITSIFKTKKDWFYYFNFSVLISLLMSLYALGQKFGLEFLLKSSGGSRLTATIGNASFLAAYLLLHIFLCIFLFINTKNRNLKIIYGLIFLFEIYILFETKTRGAILGFIGGLLVLSFLSVIFLKNKKIRKSFACLFIVLIILSTSIWICRNQTWVIKNNALHRLTTISLNDVTTQSRLLGWQGAWKGWKDRFFLGYGYENYNIAFNKYFPVLIYRDAGSQIWFDRAHNIVFDQAVAGGIFGLLAYISIFIIALLILWRKRHSNYLSCIILISLLIAYFFQNLFVFDTMGTYIFFYFILGYISYLSLNTTNIENQEIISKPANELNPFWIFILILIFIFSCYNFNIKPAKANYLSVSGLIYSLSNQHQQSIIEFKKSLIYDTYQAPEIRQNLPKIFVKAFKSGQLSEQEIQENFIYAVNELNKNIEMAPLNARHYLFSLVFYNNSSYLRSENINEIIDLGHKALELSPTRPQFYTIMGQAEMNKGNIEQSIDYFKKAVALNPKVTEQRWNLAVAHIIADQNDLAEQEFAAMEDLGWDYYSVNNLEKLTRVYTLKKDYIKNVFLYKELIKLEPENFDWYTKLAASYKETDQIQEAKQAVEKAVELNPDLKAEAEKFLESLE